MMKKTGVQRNFWRVSEIFGDENTENKCFCAETCLKIMCGKGKL